MLQPHHPVGRELRPQVLGPDRRPPSHGWRHPLLPRNPLQVVLQQRRSHVHGRPRCRSFFPARRVTKEGVANRDPTQQAQEKNYLFLVDLQKFALTQLKDGVIAKDAYIAVIGRIESERPDLAPYFVKTAGFGVRFSSLLGWLPTLGADLSQ